MGIVFGKTVVPHPSTPRSVSRSSLRITHKPIASLDTEKFASHESDHTSPVSHGLVAHDDDTRFRIVAKDAHKSGCGRADFLAKCTEDDRLLWISQDGGYSWTHVSGTVEQPAIAADGTLAAVNEDDRIMWMATDERWKLMKQTQVKQLAVGTASSMAYLDQGGKMYRYDRSLEPLHAGVVWREVPGTAISVGLGADNSFWHVDERGRVFWSNPGSRQWVKVSDSDAKMISVADVLHVFILTVDGDIQQWVGADRSWKTLNVPLPMKWVAAGEGALTCVDYDGKMYLYRYS